MNSSDSYVLVTAAYNEDAYIEATIRSVIAQEVRPLSWIIVSDASTDRTDAIVERYAAVHDFIHLHRLTASHARDFAAQANAINEGIRQLIPCSYGFVGNLDADITFEPSYFRLLIDKFAADPQLGVGGGTICERCGDGVFRSRPLNRLTSVAHAVQLFRRECFEAIGGCYAPLPYGAPDTYAEITAQMKGWNVSSFPDLEAFHHRPTNSAGGLLRGCFRQGRMDHSIGVLPAFEVAKLVRRMGSKPYIIGALTRFAGFVYSYIRGDCRAVPAQFVTFLRREQTRRLTALFCRKLKADSLS